jgi:hypothetical protein
MNEDPDVATKTQFETIYIDDDKFEEPNEQLQALEE